jgi:hypothetical protein
MLARNMQNIYYSLCNFYKVHTHTKIQTLKSLTNNLANNYFNTKLHMVRLVIKCTIQLS